MADIRNTIAKCSESFNALNFQLVDYSDAKGEKRPMYLLSKDGFMMVVMGYVTPEAIRIKETYISKFNEMEAIINSGGYRLPRVPQSFSDALRMIADIEEEKERALKERDEVVRVNYVITEELEEAKDQIGFGTNYKRIAGIPWLRHYFNLNLDGVYKAIGKNLSRFSRSMGYKIEKIENSNYGQVNGYHIDVIKEFKKILNSDPNLMYEYRIPRKPLRRGRK